MKYIQHTVCSLFTSEKFGVMAKPITGEQFHGDEHIVPVGHAELMGPVQEFPQHIRVTEYDENCKG